MRRLTFRRTRWLLLGTVLGAVLAGGAAATLASIPDAGGVIHGCYQKNVGNLRVIDPAAGERCRPPEIAISWSQTGPQGLQARRATPAQRARPGRREQREPPARPARPVRREQRVTPALPAQPAQPARRARSARRGPPDRASPASSARTASR
jgi:hypothetical protein